MKRGSMIVVVVSIACNPWRFLTQAVVFVEVFSVFAGQSSSPPSLSRDNSPFHRLILSSVVFATATVAIINTDYWIIRRRKWKIPDLYERHGIYWFWHGINWRAIITWIIAVIPAFRKSPPHFRTFTPARRQLIVSSRLRP